MAGEIGAAADIENWIAQPGNVDASDSPWRRQQQIDGFGLGQNQRVASGSVNVRGWSDAN